MVNLDPMQYLGHVGRSYVIVHAHRTRNVLLLAVDAVDWCESESELGNYPTVVEKQTWIANCKYESVNNSQPKIHGRLQVMLKWSVLPRVRAIQMMMDLAWRRWVDRVQVMQHHACGTARRIVPGALFGPTTSPCWLGVWEW